MHVVCAGAADGFDQGQNKIILQGPPLDVVGTHFCPHSLRLGPGQLTRESHCRLQTLCMSMLPPLSTIYGYVSVYDSEVL